MIFSELTSVLGAVVFLFGFQVYLSSKSQRKFVEIKFQVNNLQKEIRSLRRTLEKVSTELLEKQMPECFNDLKLYIGNIDYSASEDELEQLFAKFGHIELVNIPVDKYSGKARGFGFVTFDDPAAAARALELNGAEFKGRQIQVNFAKERAA